VLPGLLVGVPVALLLARKHLALRPCPGQACAFERHT
jgi:hypothetical protein